ncbi:hypothetical protein [Helicobacter sp. MIT 14-3879]|uniref:hypothetical protein n=1 Tax=Helicobacter sp. MIT 14-3879 TaxID=2040649 RepID=UPI000E1E6347|nr:hypothetical protein [Helicobacter sp. MIT 14-3879]RDU58741.1 hypothetical protein CQA44_12175 [Helicobacter sp. MIT 14-3879]
MLERGIITKTKEYISKKAKLDCFGGFIVPIPVSFINKIRDSLKNTRWRGGQVSLLESFRIIDSDYRRFEWHKSL